MTATPPNRRGRTTTPLLCLLVATAPDLGGAYHAPRNGHASRRAARTSPQTPRPTTHLAARQLPPGGDPGPTGGRMRRRKPGGNTNNAPAKPAWQENLEYWAERAELEKLNKDAAKTKKGPSMGTTVGSMYNDGGNTFAHMYQKKTTDQFKRPYEFQDDEDEEHVATNDFNLPPTSPRRVDSQTLPSAREGGANALPGADGGVPEWFGSDTRVGDAEYGKLPPTRPQKELPPSGGARQQSPRQPRQPQQQRAIFNPNANRHTFQTSSTDDFKKPFGMPDNLMQPSRPPPRKEVKAPFQTSSTDDFRRPQDTMSGVGAPQQPLYQKPPQMPQSPPQGGMGRADSPAWRNSMGQDVYGSTQLGEARDAVIVDASARGNGPPVASQSAAPMTDFNDYNHPQGAVRRRSRSKTGGKMMLRPIQWPTMRDPPGVFPDHPSLAMRLLSTVLATLSTWYLHLHRGHSPVLASSAITLLLSTCLDRRLGQPALCGSLAGMAGGHLAPDPAVALALGGMTWGWYELLIRINDVGKGMGGRLGATAFLATSLVAKYRGVGSVGRKMRRAAWSNAGPSGLVVSMVVYHVLGAVATILLREASDDDSDGAAADPVRASSVVGVLGALFFRDPTASLAVYGGSLVGASLPSRLMDGNGPVQPKSALSLAASFAGAGAMAGLIHAVSIHAGYWNGGWGGKVGLCAFAGCWIYHGFGNVAQFVKRRG